MPASAQYGDQPIEATDLLELRQIDDVAVSPDGRQIAYVVRQVVSFSDESLDSLENRSHIFLVDASGSTPPRQLTRGEASATSPVWNPDGDRLAFVRSVDGTSQVFVMPLFGGESYSVTDLEHGAGSPRWSPDGSRLLVSSALPEKFVADHVGDEPPSERPGRSGRSDAEANPDGSIEAVRAWLDDNGDRSNPRVFHRLDLQGEHDLEPAPAYRHLFVVDVDTTTAPTMITSGFATFESAEWLPDGESVVASGFEFDDVHADRTNARNLYRVRADGSDVTRMLSLPNMALGAPAVSPDGQRIAFTARDTSDLGYAETQIGVFEISNPSSARILTDELDRSASAPRWSQDGWFLYFTASSNGGVPLYRVRPFFVPDLPPDTASTDSVAADTVGDDVADAGVSLADSESTSDTSLAADTTLTTEDSDAPADVGPAIEIERLTSFERGVRDFDIGRASVFFVATDVANPYELYVGNPSVSQERRLTAHNAWIEDKRVSFPERRTLMRDSLSIEYWVMKPAFFDSTQQVPLLVQIHGGPMSMWGPGEATMWHEFQFFASKGYGIVFANPRGSGGYGYDFKRANYLDWGASPAGDVLAAADEAAALPWVDPDRQVITGGSYAGYLTAWIVAHDQRFDAAVAQRGVYDLTTFLGEGNAWRLVPTHFGGYPWQQETTMSPSEIAVFPAADTLAAAADQSSGLSPADILRLNSPLTFVEQIRTPLLIMHADRDLRTGVSQSEMLYKSLKILDRPVEYVRYPDAGHDLSRTGHPRQRIDRLLRIYEFFERYLP